MVKDFLDEIVAERTADNPVFPELVVYKTWLRMIDQALDVGSQDDAAFTLLVAHGISLSRLTDSEFAEQVNVSRPTVSRWRKGQSVPHPSIRPTIYRILRHWVLAVPDRRTT